RSALRPSAPGTAGERLFQAMGGDTPWRWPAWAATGAIGLAFVCSLAGFIWFLDDHHRVEALREETADKQRERQALAKAPSNEAPAARQERQAKRKELADENEAASKTIKKIEHHWVGSVDWVRLSHEQDQRQGLALTLGFKIDHLSAIMF